MDNQQTIPDFYDGKSVFITGGTGFLGKVFIAKLLMDCPKINKIYVLIREKGDSVTKRFAEQLDNPIYFRLRQDNPEALKKIVSVAGDVTALNLGISADDEKELVEKVSIVFHIAASVKFNEPLRQALKVNVEGTMQVLKLCQRIKNIQIMIHISTAYAYSMGNSVIEEKLYPPPADLTDVYFRLNEKDNGDVTDILNGWPNTYIFTKALAESYLDTHRAHVPVVIVRPSTVTAIEHGPLEGWLENWYGATGILVPIARGYNRVVFGEDNNLADLIPVDYVVNLSIAAAAMNERPKDVAVYNICSSSSNPLSLRQLINLFVENSVQNRDYIFPFPGINFVTRNKWIIMLITVLLQLIPSYLADLVRRLRGKTPRYVKFASRLIKFRDSLDFFTLNSWVMKNDRVRALYASLDPQDQQTFPCDPTHINWRLYVAKYYDGVRRYVERRK